MNSYKLVLNLSSSELEPLLEILANTPTREGVIIHWTMNGYPGLSEGLARILRESLVRSALEVKVPGY